MLREKGRGITRMFTRQFLLILLVMTVSSPIVAFAGTGDSTSTDTPVFSLITAESKCDEETLGVSEHGSTVALEPVWEAKIYSCASGSYLDADTVRAGGVDAGGREISVCKTCPEGVYCPGVINKAFDESDAGQESCPAGYSSVAGSEKITECFRTAAVACSAVAPYEIEHGSLTFANQTVSCKIYYKETGNESVCDEQLTQDACVVTGANCDEGYRLVETNGVWSCEQLPKTEVKCEAGYYLPKNSKTCAECTQNHYCPGATYQISATTDQGIEACPDSLKSPVSASSVKDCGIVMHINGDVLYLHKDKRGPSLVIKGKDADTLWYADATSVSEEGGKQPISKGASKELHVMINGQEHTVHNTLCRESETCSSAQ